VLIIIPDQFNQSIETDSTNKEKVDPETKVMYQWLNIISFVLAIGANYAQGVVMPIT